MPALSITRIDATQEAAAASRALAELRQRLSPAGNVVSEAGKRRTIEVFGEPLSPAQVVERICSEVRQRGLDAVLEYTRKLDGATLTPATLRVSARELAEAHQQADPRLLATIRRVRERVSKFQQALLPQDVRLAGLDGGYLTQRYLPLARVGVCVPGGAAAYPSTLLMTIVPAQAAGVKEIAVIAPPTKFGSYNADVLATCQELGVSEVYRVGGAHGVAALAYGVAGLPRVDKIVGPGNLFVALAKQRVFGEVDIDSIAGPSEVVVIGDDQTPASYTAADLIAQAEHAPGASILITWSRRLYDEVSAELERQLSRLSRGELARQSLEEFGALILVAGPDEACRLANGIAPEHLHIATEPALAEQLLAKIPQAGAAFLGPDSPVAVGDYVAGPSHVLPTGGTARYASPLSSTDFLRSTSVIRFSRSDLEATIDDVRQLADTEGLTAHRASVDVRVT
ncbi:MAG: histidinol dehydrogenase [Planctomycetaceae bacterium]|nr:histidinol dehydrogenase [Planctomycetaceae bacterium]